MDPVTLALIGAGILGALSIKRGAAPPPPAAPETPQEAPGLSLGGFPPPAFGSGRGLRPAVTHREVSKERNIEGSDERGRELGEEPAKVAPLSAEFGLSRAQEAIASGRPGDVVGGGGGGGYAPRPTGTSTGTFGLIGTTPFGPRVGSTSSGGFGLGGRGGIGSRY